jgi:hypothetical protein
MGVLPDAHPIIFFTEGLFDSDSFYLLHMTEEEEVAGIEYAVVRALKKYDTVEQTETQAMIRLALRQGRMLSRTLDPKTKLDSLSKSSEALSEATEKVVR